MTRTKKRALIYVQHLLGIGHLRRSLQLAAALAERGFRVELVSGGQVQTQVPMQAIHLTQLPPLRSADGSFTRLLDDQDNEIDCNWKKRRRDLLLDVFYRFQADVLITETFPFGRRMMRFELLPLLQAALASSSRPLIISSIRDILQPKSKPGRNQEICDLVDRFYDHVLVHGDENIATLEDSFSLAAAIDDKLSYSGYISNTDYPSPPGDEGFDEVLVSAGGSATGLEILKTAIAAKPLSCLRNKIWRLLVSPSISADDFQALQDLDTSGIILQRNRVDFTGLLRRARLSISPAGYNTITDILQSDTPACVIPYAEADEIEQTIRARRLQMKGRLIMLEEKRLCAQSLAEAIQQATLLKSDMPAVELDGARQSAIYIERWLEEARPCVD